MAQLPLPTVPESWIVRWKSLLDPIISVVTGQVIGNPLTTASYFTGVKLTTGSNQVPINLTTAPTGWFITDINADAVVYRSAAFNSSTLVLTTSADCVIDLAVY